MPARIAHGVLALEPSSATPPATSSSTFSPSRCTIVVGAPRAERRGRRRASTTVTASDVAGRARPRRRAARGSSCARSGSDDDDDRAVDRGAVRGATVRERATSVDVRGRARRARASSAHGVAHLLGERRVGHAAPRAVDGHDLAPRRPTWATPPGPTGPGRGRRRSSRRMRSAGTAARPGGSTLAGSISRSAHDRTAGRSHLGLQPAVVVLAARVRRASPSIARWRTPVRNGRSSSSASSGPTWPVSASTELRPVSTRSNGPSRSSAAASACAVASVSEPANAGSVTSTPSMSTSRSRPHAIASRSVSSAGGGPSVNTVTREPGALGGELDRLAHRAPAVRVHLELDAVAAQPSVGPELHLLELRDLLHQHRDARAPQLTTCQVMTREAVIVDCAAHRVREAQGCAGRVASHRSARARCCGRSSSATTSTPRASTTWSAAASPSRASRAATSRATRGSRPGCRGACPATSVDRQCGSSQQAAHFVAQGVIAGAYDIGIACGVESMTRAPMSSNARGGTGPFSREFLAQHEQHARHPVLGRAGARRQVGHHARGDGRVRAAVAPARRREHRQRVLRRRDRARCRSRTRPGSSPARCSTPTKASAATTTLEKLAALPPAWESDDQPAPDITAGNASQMTDGASAMLIADRPTSPSGSACPIRARFAPLRGRRRGSGARAVGAGARSPTS